jgi:hypothetical protein
MTVGPLPQASSEYYHPRRSSNNLSRELDFLYARMPLQNANRDLNNNELVGEPMEICYNTGFKPNKLCVTLNGDQLSVYGQSCSNKHFRCFGDTFILPENVDPNNVYCEVTGNNQLSISMQQMAFEVRESSALPLSSAKSGGLW